MSGAVVIGPARAAMLALQRDGFKVRELWCGGQFDGLSATKKVGALTVEVYAGNADNGDYTDNHYAPVVYLCDRRIASTSSVAKAARVANFRALLAHARAA